MQTISVLSWNIQGKFNITGFTRHKKAAPHLLQAKADIVAIQELHNAHERLT